MTKLTPNIDPLTLVQVKKYALSYLKRYHCTTQQLKAYLLRKNGVEKDIDLVILELVSKNMMNDALYAQSKAESLFNRGKSPRYIEAWLKQKGIEADMLPSLDEQAAAHIFARKKKLGVYRVKEGTDLKDLEKLARAGFSYQAARRALMGKSD